MAAATDRTEEPPEDSVGQTETPAGSRERAAAIAAEAVGERGRSATPEIVRDRVEKPPEESLRQDATPAGSQKNAAAIAAEAVGERVGDAYPDTTETAGRPSGEAATPAGSGTAGDMLAAGSQAAKTLYRRFDEQPLLMMLAGVALGYTAALLIHGRR
ncbi:MAG TPA: hypothetical protein VJ770_24010 [Stellaceae bacterium]|nr:hypothetical protein [Stellaceae bacterium]